MAITVNFNGMNIQKPGNYGPTYSDKQWQQIWLCQFLYKLGVRWQNHGNT
jgi:hypothetical protein